MSASLVLLALLPAAPVPKAPPPPVEVTARRYVYPPRDVGKGQLVHQDDGHFIEVTIKNNSTDTLSFKSRHDHNLSDLVYVKITDEKGKEVSQAGYHLMLLCSSVSKPVAVQPGKSVTVVAHLLRDWPHTTRGEARGKYTARVMFTTDKVRAESADTFELEFTK
jgi:hypothetical protein